MKLFEIPLLLTMIGATTFLMGCDAKDSEDCVSKLNQKKYQEVANSSSCDPYEKASAELALGGFEFAKFLDPKAADNFGQTLGLEQNRSLDNDIIPHYTKAQELIGIHFRISKLSLEKIKTTLAEYKVSQEAIDRIISELMPLLDTDFQTQSAFESQLLVSLASDASNRSLIQLIERKSVNTPRKLAEISLFAHLGQVIVETYGRIDTNLNGSLETGELYRFLGVLDSSKRGDTSVSQTTEGKPTYQLIDSTGNSWLLRDSVCINNGTNYTGVFDKTIGTVTTCPTQWSSLSVVVGLDQLTTLFDPAESFDKLVAFLAMYSQHIQVLRLQLLGLAIRDDHAFNKNVEQSVGKIDTGGGCGSTESKLIISLGKFVEKLACTLASTASGTACSTTVSDLKTANILSPTLLKTLVPSFSIDPTQCPKDLAKGCESADVRIIFRKTDGTYTDYYSQADTLKVSKPLQQLSWLTLNNGKFVVSEAKDSIVTFEELLCTK